MQQGGAQASIFSASEVPRAEALGLVRLLRLEDVVPLPESGLATTETKLANQRPQVTRVLRAMVRALQYTKSKREGTLPVFMQFLSISRDEAAEAYDASVYAYSDDGTVSERTLRYAIDAEKQQLKLAADVRLPASPTLRRSTRSSPSWASPRLQGARAERTPNRDMHLNPARATRCPHLLSSDGRKVGWRPGYADH